MHDKNELTGYSEGIFVLLQCKLFKLHFVLTTFYLRAFEGSLETKRSTAMTLVPIAPPGGKGECNAECRRLPPN